VADGGSRAVTQIHKVKDNLYNHFPVREKYRAMPSRGPDL
jgi:hypothetical protein